MLIATSENFGSLSGMVKDFLERVYYPCEGKVEGKPYSVLVCASNDGAGAMLQTDRIATGLRLRKVHPGTIYRERADRAGAQSPGCHAHARAKRSAERSQPGFRAVSISD